jgi:parallel beta-helix repeat protein
MHQLRLTAILVALSAAVGGMYLSRSGEAQQPAGVLPGAKPIIEAARFPSLQAALDAVPLEGGVVRLPPGTFEISQPLIVRHHDLLIEGAGTATHIKNVNTSGQSALVLKPKDPEAGRRVEPQWRLMLSNFRITGNEKSGHGIEAIKVNELYVQGVTISYHGGDGIRLDGCYEDPRICNSLITYNKKSGLNVIATHDIVVSGNQFEENFDGVRCSDSFNLCLTGNCLDDHLGDGVVIENTYGSVVSGNMIEECKGTGIILNRDAYGITLSSNVIAHEDGDGIDLRDAHGCAVSGNTFVVIKKAGLRIGRGSGRITVTGNNFCNGYVGDDKRKFGPELVAGGIALDGTADITISGNTFSDIHTHALAVTGECPRIILSANTFRDCNFAGISPNLQKPGWTITGNAVWDERAASEK